MAKVNLTAGRITDFKCPPDKIQAFLWDSTQPGLGIRTTPAGKPAFIFQSEFQGQTLRMTIGATNVRTISEARLKARELQSLIDDGRDPRQVKAETTAADLAKRGLARTEGITVGEVWREYIEDRRDKWGIRHYQDHIAKAKPGGDVACRGTRGRGVTIAGPLYPLMALRLRDLKAPTIEAWAADEGRLRPTAGRLALRLLKAFMTWCMEHEDYSRLLTAANPAKTKKTREAFGKAQAKADAVMKEQLPAWFREVRRMPNKAVSAYLQMMLLTGARPGEILALEWKHVDTTWRLLTLRKTTEEPNGRIIPLPAYLAHVLESLPRRSKWVFANEKGTRITSPNALLHEVAKAAGIGHLTLHGLRRSFKSLAEWLEPPAGVLAQIMGHEPSATAERHYTVRPVDLLRVHHERIVSWIIEQAQVELPAPGNATGSEDYQLREAYAESATV